MTEVDTASMAIIKPEDKGLIVDVLRVVGSLKCCSSYVVNLAPKGYEVIAWLHTDKDVEVTTEEQELIEQVNDVRVKTIGVRTYASNGKVGVRIRVISMTEPCMISETVLLKIRKRSRWAT